MPQPITFEDICNIKWVGCYYSDEDNFKMIDTYIVEHAPSAEAAKMALDMMSLFGMGISGVCTDDQLKSYLEAGELQPKHFTVQSTKGQQNKQVDLWLQKWYTRPTIRIFLNKNFVCART